MTIIDICKGLGSFPTLPPLRRLPYYVCADPQVAQPCGLPLVVFGVVGVSCNIAATIDDHQTP